MRHSLICAGILTGALAAGLMAQTGIPVLRRESPPPAEPAPQQAAPAPAPTPAAAAPSTVAAQPQRLADAGLLSMDNVSLTELINLFGKMLKLNFILDPRVRGTVTIHTYGEVKPVDLMPLLQTILRVNSCTLVQVGDLYRIVPINTVSQLPISPVVNADPKTLPEDERVVLNLIFLKYATAGEMDKLLSPFYGEGASHSTYEPANLLILQDNSRNMRRTMELIAMFDSDSFAGQRVRLFDIENSRPTDLVKDLDSVFKAYALAEKTSIKFLPIDRINTIIAVAPNPGIFAEVQKWIDKLDIPVKMTAGAVSNWVYRLKYGRAEMVAMAIMALYSGDPFALMGMAAQANQGMYSAGIGQNGTGYGQGGGMYGSGMNSGMNSGMGYNSYGSYGSTASGMYGAMGRSNSYGGSGYSGMGYGASQYGSGAGQYSSATGGLGNTARPDQTGSYLGASSTGGPSSLANMPHIVPNPLDNTLLVQGTPQDWEQIQNLLRQLDVPPRQVLIDAKIYEVDLSGEFALGVQSYLQDRGTSQATTTTNNSVSNSGQTIVSGLTAAQGLAATAGPGGLALTAGAMVLKSKQLLGLLTASESTGRSKVISAPSVIATSGIPATMNVGSQIPVATSSGISGITSGGTSSVVQGVSNQSSGVTLSITALVNSSGVVTMVINQQVSAPQANSYSKIDSPSFSNRSVSTQVTVQDGDTVAIGGAITESRTESSAGVPFLHRIPFLGAAFGSKTSSTSRSELIIFLTPRVIYDTNQLSDATEEIKSHLKRVAKMMKDEQ